MANGSEAKDFKPDRPIVVTDQMVEAASWFLSEWLGAGRSSRGTINESLKIGVAGVLMSALGNKITIDSLASTSDVLQEVYGIKSSR